MLTVIAHASLQVMKESQSKDGVKTRWDIGLNKKRAAYSLFRKVSLPLGTSPSKLRSAQLTLNSDFVQIRGRTSCGLLQGMSCRSVGLETTQRQDA